jgi:hypothetical protein
MTASNFNSKPNVPATVADLDPDVVTEFLARHACNVTDAAADLAVSASDLRRLLWANPKLRDQAFEVVEARLDKAEKNIAEALHSDDPRMRVAASMFTLRNSVRAKRRGWITSSAAAVDLTIAAGPQRKTVFTWRPTPSELRDEEAQKKEAHRQAEVRRAQAEGHKVVQFSWGDSGGKDEDDDSNSGWRPPVYDDGRRKGDIEGELAGPSVLLEHAAAEPEPAEDPAEESAVVEPAAAEPEPESVVIEAPVPAVESAAARYERELIDAWIRNRLIAYPLASCFGCRRPIVAGQDWQEVSNGDTNARARFHRACHAEWRAEREAAARQALGLEG